MPSDSKSRTLASMDNSTASSSMADWLNSSYNLHLDLVNFQSVDADDSPYILSSPRSLEACTRLEIQPIELLHKDLMQFEEECLLTARPLSDARRPEEECLLTARMLSDARRPEEECLLTARPLSDARRPEEECLLTARPLSDARRPEEECLLTARPLSDARRPEEECLLTARPLSDARRPEEECLLTARPLSDARRLYEEHEKQRCRKLKQCRRLRERMIHEQEEEGNARCESRHHSQDTRSPKTDHGYSIKNRSLEFGQGDNRETTSDEPQRPASANITHQRSQTSNRLSTTPSNERRQTTQSTITHHKPASPIVMIPGIIRSKIRGQQERSVSSCSSRQSFSRLSSTSGVSVLSDRDQKILDLLEKKYKDEKLVEEMRQETRLAWDEQRQTEERSKVKNDMQRRKNLAEANWARRKKKEREQRQQQLKKEQHSKDVETDIEYRDVYHARLVTKQQALMQHQIHLKKLEDAGKKSRQKQVLKKREQTDKEYHQSVSDHLTVTQERAERLRRWTEDQAAVENQEQSWKGQLRHSSTRASLDKDNEEYMSSLKESILLKQSRAERNLTNRHWLQEHGMKLSRQKKESLQEKSRQNRREIEDENRHWQRQVMYESLMAQERAAQQANETVQSKAEKARHARRSRELTHGKLKKRVDEDEALYQESIKLDLAYKDMKSQLLATQKQDSIQRSRVVAMESAKLRDQVRQQYQGSFDKMVERAQYQSILGRGPQMSTKNYNTFTLT